MLLQKVNKHFFRKIHYHGINKEVSIFCNNCISGFLYKRINAKILSPITWCLMLPDDMIKFALNMENYLNMRLVECEPLSSDYKVLGGDKVTFPCAKLGDLKIMFHNDEGITIKSLCLLNLQRLDYI